MGRVKVTFLCHICMYFVLALQSHQEKAKGWSIKLSSCKTSTALLGNCSHCPELTCLGYLAWLCCWLHFGQILNTHCLSSGLWCLFPSVLLSSDINIKVGGSFFLLVLKSWRSDASKRHWAWSCVERLCYHCINWMRIECRWDAA